MKWPYFCAWWPNDSNFACLMTLTAIWHSPSWNMKWGSLTRAQCLSRQLWHMTQKLVKAASEPTACWLHSVPCHTENLKDRLCKWVRMLLGLGLWELHSKECIPGELRQEPRWLVSELLRCHGCAQLIQPREISWWMLEEPKSNVFPLVFWQWSKESSSVFHKMYLKF